MTNQIIKTTKAPAPIGPYSQAVKAGNFLFISGQVAIDPSTAEMKNEPAGRSNAGYEKPFGNINKGRVWLFRCGENNYFFKRYESFCRSK